MLSDCPATVADRELFSCCFTPILWLSCIEPDCWVSSLNMGRQLQPAAPPYRALSKAPAVLPHTAPQVQGSALAISPGPAATVPIVNGIETGGKIFIPIVGFIVLCLLLSIFCMMFKQHRAHKARLGTLRQGQEAPQQNLDKGLWSRSRTTMPIAAESSYTDQQSPADSIV